MHTILAVISSLDFSGGARQLTLLAAHLPRDRFRCVVVVLGGDTSWARNLRQAGIEVHTLGRHRPFDLLPFFTLRRLFKTLRPEIVHVWGLAALRMLTLVRLRWTFRLIVSDALPVGRALSWPERLLLRRSQIITVPVPSERTVLERHGVAADKILLIPPAIDPHCFIDDEPAAPTLPIPPSVRVILGIGPLEPRKSFRDAIWALDILHYLYGDLCLVLAGDGSDRKGLEDFCVSAESTSRVHFLGRVDDLTPWLRRASVVWSTSRLGGVISALEAAAAGRPVVAYRVPGQNDVVLDGVTGYLVDPGDKPVLARQTRFLLDDATMRHEFGRAARKHATAYTPERLADAYANLYDGC